MCFRTLIRTIVIVVASYGFFHVAFAQGVIDDSNIINNTAKLLHILISFLGWARVGLAALAGKLMTNDFVFGSAFHMDVYLLQLWVMMRNIANYVLGFGFIFFIGRTLWTQDVDISSVVKQVGGFVLAGFLINFSLFFVQALVDISTIGVTAVGSMSELFVSSNKPLNDAIAEIKGKKISVTYDKEGNLKSSSVVANTQVSAESIIDSILPKNNSVAGPFIYLGASILKMQQYTLLRENLTQDEVNAMIKAQNLALGSLIQLAIIVAFTLALAVLVIVNIIRIGMIWMLVALGPIFFLIWGLKRGGVNLPNGMDLDTIAEGKFAFKSFIQMIFVPVFTTLMLSLTLIFSTTIYTTLHSSDTINKGPDNTTSYNQATDKINDVIDMTYEGNLIGEGVKNAFADLIIALMTIFLVRMIARYSIPTNNPVIGTIGKQIFKTAEAGLGSLPIIHVPGYGTTSASALKKITSRRGQNSINPLAIGDRISNKRQSTSNNNANAFVNKVLGTDTGTFNTNDIDQSLNHMNTITSNSGKQKIEAFFTKATSLAKAKNVSTFSFKGSDFFTDGDDGVLKALQDPITKSPNNIFGRPGDKSSIQSFYTDSVVKALVEQLKGKGFVPENNIVPTTLDRLQNTVFALKQ